MTVGRGDVDDAPALLRRHHPQFVLQAEQQPEHVRVENGGVVLDTLIDNRSTLALVAGTVDSAVDPAEPGHGLIDQLPHLVFATDVGLNERGFGAQAAKFGLECLAFGLTPARDDQAGAILGEGDGGSATYACEGSGDQDDWPFHGAAPPAGFSAIRLVWTPGSSLRFLFDRDFVSLVAIPLRHGANDGD